MGPVSPLLYDVPGAPAGPVTAPPKPHSPIKMHCRSQQSIIPLFHEERLGQERAPRLPHSHHGEGKHCEITLHDISNGREIEEVHPHQIATPC